MSARPRRVSQLDAVLRSGSLGQGILMDVCAKIGYGSNKKTKYMMPSGHKAFVVSNTNDVELLLMHNRTHAAEYVLPSPESLPVVNRLHNCLVPGGATLANISQDRPQRLREEEDRHHRPREATRRQGHEPQGEGHDGGMNVTLVRERRWGNGANGGVITESDDQWRIKREKN